MKDLYLTSFLDLGLAEPITRALVDERYATPTPIQAQTIPHVLATRDVVGIAQTGTGKTAAFALPMLHHLSSIRLRPQARACRTLVLSPTRELAAQIVESFATYGRYLNPTIALAIGGVPIKPQMRALAAGVDVLVATPGRLRDLLQMGAVRLDHVEIFVLDEADRMLDMGFIHDIRAVVAKLPQRRQNLFFSATMPAAISELAGQLLRNPIRLAAAPAATTVERVRQQVMHVDRAAKPALLAEVLRQDAVERVLVFTRTKRGADKVVRALNKAGLAAEAIHGNKSQNQRERVLAAFRAGRLRTLIATDIAARGIDVEGISHVVNYDLPNIPESYVHRIGRTARAGADGIAISFCDADERPFLRDIEKLIRMSLPAGERRSTRRAAVEHGANGAARASPQRPQAKRSRTHQQQAPSLPSPAKLGRRDHGRKPQATANQQHPQRHPAAAEAGIGAIAFMQPRGAARRHASGRPTQRTPR